MKLFNNSLIWVLSIAFTWMPNAFFAQQRTIKTDALELMFVTNFTNVYADHGTGADRDLSTWKATLPPGFSALGHYAKSGYGAPQTVMLAVRAIDPTALAFPTDYKFIYNDGGTGGDMDGSFWQPIPPPGYRALGTVTMRSHGKPALNEVVCVRNDLTTYASVGKFIWNDGGSGGDRDVSLWQINPPRNSQDNKESFITSGSFCGHGSYGTLNSSEVAYAIKVKMPSQNKNIRLEKPRLNGLSKPVEKTQMKLATVAYLPCISINDRVFANNLQRQVRETPIYTLERYDYYKLQDFNTSYSDADGTMSFSYTTGMTKSHEKSISETFETSATVETGFYGVNVSVTVGYALDQTNTYSTEDMTERTLSKEFTVPGNGAGALYTLSHIYKLKRGSGEVIDTWEMSTKFAHFTDFVPQTKKESNTPSQTATNTNQQGSTNPSGNKMSVSQSQLSGTYRVEPYQNGWHQGRFDGGNLTWTNEAGATWGLEKQAIRVSDREIVYQTDRRNPYYDTGHRTFTFKLSNGQVEGFYFGNGYYARKSEQNSTNTQSLASNLAGSTWQYYYQGNYFNIRFGTNGNIELLEQWNSVKWKEINANQVELFVPGHAQKMLLSFDAERSYFETIDWDGSQTAGYRR
ncbi:MAG: Vps62-related protein [Bacteroidia bacterium]|nr:Vps62-related protein [Bacteroidia bacterium]